MGEHELDSQGIHTLLHQEGRFLAFLRSRLGRPDAAEDILQAAYLKSLERSAQLRSEQSIVAWFYTLLRHSVADHFRAQRREAMDDGAAMDFLESPEDAELRRSCEDCVRMALRRVRQEEAQLIEWVDLEGLSVAEAGERLSLAPKVISQRLFRARQALQARLQELCRSCTATKCVYCRCPAEGQP